MIYCCTQNIGQRPFMETIEGIILRTLPFEDFHRIATLFTADMGITKFFIRDANHPQKRMQLSFLQPFSKVELVYQKGKGDLNYYQDGSLLQLPGTAPHGPGELFGANALAQALLMTQLPHKPSQKLYTLFDIYLQTLFATGLSLHLVSSFYLKLLSHEGLIRLKESCSSCHAPLSDAFFSDGEFYCRSHTSSHSLQFTEGEKEQLIILGESRSLREIVYLNLNEKLPIKIKSLFDLMIYH